MSEQSERKDRAVIIAAKCKLTQTGNIWQVPSQSGFKPFYSVDPVAKTCDCPDCEKREAHCKHIYAVEIVIERESSTTTTTTTDANGNTTTTTTATETVKVTKRVTYGQDWTAYNQAQTHEKAIFQKEFCPVLYSGPPPHQNPLRFAVSIGEYETV